MLRVLGPVEIDGHAPRSTAQRILLAALALDAGDVVSSGRLAELIWGDDQPEHPGASLQNHVSRVRRLLPATVEIRSAGDGYRLVAERGALDVASFESAFRDACASEPVDRIAIVDHALALWHGRPFVDLDDDRAEAEAARLIEFRLALRELRAESLIASGETHQAIGELDAQRREAPLRERTVELLMRAYLSAGRKHEALAAYRELRNNLVDELGLDPSLELRELELAILNEDVAVTSAPPATHATPVRPVVELPMSPLFGRDDDLERIGATVRGHRIVSLCGPGGVGKTRLALHVAAGAAADFDGGVTVVDLVSIRDPDEFAAAVATAYELPPRAGLTAEDRIVDALTGRHHLLVIDNCEHLVERAAHFVEAVARRSPQLHVLATSREPLNIDGERVARVQPLPPEGAAVDMFVERAASHAGVEASELEVQRAEVVEICTALDGLPLAIELAAARSTAMSLDEIIDGLARRFELFDKGRRTAHERHRSLRSLVDWSVRELDHDLATVFAQTSVFSATFSAHDAASVTGTRGPAVSAALIELVDRSLLVEHPAAGRPTRYGYLGTIRAYATELLALTGDTADVTERHAERVVGLVETMRSALTTADDIRAMADVMDVLPDLRIVHGRLLSDGDAERSLRLTASLRSLALFRMHAEMFRWIRQSAERFGESGHPLAETVLASASIGSWQAGDLDAARAFAERAGEVASRSPHAGAGQGYHEAMADVAAFGGDLDVGAEHFSEAADIAHRRGDELMVISDLADLAMLLGYAGREDELRDVIARARDLVTSTKSTAMSAWVAYAEGEAFAEIDPPRAMEALTRALDLAERSSAHFIAGVAGLTRAGLMVRHGDPPAAIPEIVDLIDRWRRAGAWVQLWITLRSVAELLVRLDHLIEAALVLGALDAAAGTGEASGPDAIRLADLRRRIEELLPDAESWFAAGTEMDQRRVTDAALRALAGSAVEVDAAT